MRATVLNSTIAGTYPIGVTGTSGSTTEADAMMVTITDTNREISIEIRSNAFNPDIVAVVQGTTVTWINNDAVPHRVEFTPGYLGVTSVYIDVGDYDSYMFGSIGTFDYQDSSYSDMKGTVIVVAIP
jgi:plastocyanin